jgi:2-polyprenyl-3-methyl-5-hydroxy-6-metoxy-1,4-benzoquinol methylase
MKCRHCANALDLPLIDLGSAPPSNAYLTEKTLFAPEKNYPLRVMVCTQCWLVQTEDYAHFSELFDDDYAYFSSFSSSWLSHAQAYVSQMVARFDLNQQSNVVEVAANDGYLLQYLQALGIPCLGVEPTHSTAQAARAIGLNMVEAFFGVQLAQKLVADGHSADLTAANNVLAHVPDINDFVAGFATLLKPQGVSTFEFPHLLEMMQHTQFDTIYHEHFSYLSLTAVQRIFAANGLTVFDVETLPTHGGSLRVYAQRSDTGVQAISPNVAQLLALEQSTGLTTQAFYAQFQQQSNQIKNDLIEFLIQAQKQGKKVAAYGAAAKGNTLMNYAGIRPDLIAYVVDKNPAKQNKYMPASRIPIVAESHLQTMQPDYVVILPWNLQNEVMQQLSYIQQWGGQFVVAVPKLTVIKGQ